MTYLPRTLDAQLDALLGAAGAVVIEGPRGCGKTSTAMQRAESMVRLEIDQVARELARISPKSLLAGPTPRLIDEWQVEPTIWNDIRREIDDRQAKGQFILTGSAAQVAQRDLHPGSMRMVRLKMRTMTVAEAQQGPGGVSLEMLFETGSFEPKASDFDFEQMLRVLCLGGWPSNRELSVGQATKVNSSYLEDVARVDVARVEGQRKNPITVSRLIASLARNVGTSVNSESLARELSLSGPPIKAETVLRYESVLNDLMLIETIQPWLAHLRSKDVVRVTPTRYLGDPSLVVAALGATPASLTRDLRTLGFIFENLVVRDLLVYADALGASIKHYRDSSNREIDAILELPDGRWGAIEIKLGSHRVDEAAANLKMLAKAINTDVHGKPQFLAVITMSPYSYIREDGISVIDIGSLQK